MVVILSLWELSMKKIYNQKDMKIQMYKIT